tara:strand:+ start:782 stop:1447 length:666 start_codon:yes stop_codon:yes gene_type:complete
MSEVTQLNSMRFSPIKLPYRYNSLEPYIDEETMMIHYNKHYLGYLKKFNDLVDRYDINKPVISIMQDVNQYPEDLRNNGGGYVNHSLFWKMLKPNPKGKLNRPKGACMQKILEEYGTFGEFKNLIIEASKQRFGSGWVWWVMNKDGSTNILLTPYQDNPYMPEYNSYPLLGIDVWEHAYYLQYDADREKYVKNIFNIIDWDEIENRCVVGNRSIFDVQIVN